MKLDTNALKSALTAARPALSVQSFVPILTHYLLEDDWVLAWNDMFGLGVRVPHDLSCAVPGDLFHKIVTSIQASTIEVTLEEEADEIAVRGGRTRVRVPFLPADQFPQEWLPKDNDEPVLRFAATGDFLFGLAKVLVGVGIDPTHPAQMGVTLYLEHPGRYPVLYSTDNFTVSEYILEDLEVEMPEDQPSVIMPTPFCLHLLDLEKAFDSSNIEVSVYDGLIVGRVIDAGRVMAQVSSRIVLDLTPIDFVRVMKRFDADAGMCQEVGKEFPAALSRSLMVLSESNDKVCHAVVDGSSIHFSTTTELGEVKDRVDLDLEMPSIEFDFDPELVTRALSVATRVAPSEDVFIMTDGKNFKHLIALVD